MTTNIRVHGHDMMTAAETIAKVNYQVCCRLCKLINRGAQFPISSHF